MLGVRLTHTALLRASGARRLRHPYGPRNFEEPSPERPPARARSSACAALIAFKLRGCKINQSMRGHLSIKSLPLISVPVLPEVHVGDFLRLVSVAYDSLIHVQLMIKNLTITSSG